MGHKQIVLSGKDLVKILERLGFEVIRVKGSHHRLKHKDGRVTTVPVHQNEDIAKGLLRKIVREDLGLTMEEFERMVKENI